MSAVGRRSYAIDATGPICLRSAPLSCRSIFFFFNDTATTEIYTLSLHDALPIYLLHGHRPHRGPFRPGERGQGRSESTRLNSSHVKISYAVFCLNKKKTTWR